MNNKTLVSISLLSGLLVAAGLAQAQQSSVTVYGLIDAALQTTNGAAVSPGVSGNQHRLTSGGIQGSRYGFKGSEDLGGGLKAVFDLENQFDVSTGQNKSSSQAFSRKADVGITGDFGRLTVGRHTVFSYDVQDELDPVQFANFTPLGNSGDAPVTKFADYQVVNARRDNSVKYNFSSGGLSAGLMVAFGEVAGNSSANSSLGGKLGYGAQGFKVLASVDQVKDAKGAKALGTTLGATYSYGAVTGFVGVVNIKNDFQAAGGFGQTNTVWWLGARYAVLPALALHLGYYDQKQSDTATAAGVAQPKADGKAQTLSFLADYTLSKRSDVYFSLQNSWLKDGMVAAMSPSGRRDQVASALLGVRHKF